MMSSNTALLTPEQSAHVNPVLEFRDGQFMFRMTNMEGGIVERFISPASAREAFTAIPIDTGWLQPGIVRWGDGRHGEWAVVYFPPASHELEITNEGTSQPYQLERVIVPLPGLVFFGIGTNYFLWAVKTERLDPYQEIFRAPLPNVYQSGAICWGLVKPPRSSARTIFQAWKLFITSTFNNHLANGKSKRSRDDVRVVLKDMARAPQPAHYPVADLIRQVDARGVTLDQAIKAFFETGEMPG